MFLEYQWPNAWFMFWMYWQQVNISTCLLKDGQAQILHADKTLETIPTANFEETENTDLAQRFRSFY